MSEQITTTGLSAHPARSAAGYPQVQGRCPACQSANLFLAVGGYVTCASLRCPDPIRASYLLEARGVYPHDPRYDEPGGPG